MQAEISLALLRNYKISLKHLNENKYVLKLHN